MEITSSIIRENGKAQTHALASRCEKLLRFLTVRHVFEINFLKTFF